jgi:hypothetical protein
MKIKKFALAALTLALLSPSLPAAAGDLDTRDHTELISETSEPLEAAEARAFFAGPAKDDRVLVIPAAMIIMAGVKVWNVIINNRPSADLASAYASAIPGFDFNWEDLKDWRKVTKKYRFTMDSKLQGRAVDIVYEVSFFHGAVPTPGSAGRKGHYIANFTVKPLDIKLKWGWKVALTASMSNPMNVGTASEPVAWLNADLKWQYAKPLTTEPKIQLNSITVDGLGSLGVSGNKEISIPLAPAEQAPAEAPAVAWN